VDAWRNFGRTNERVNPEFPIHGRPSGRRSPVAPNPTTPATVTIMTAQITGLRNKACFPVDRKIGDSKSTFRQLQLPNRTTANNHEKTNLDPNLRTSIPVYRMQAARNQQREIKYRRTQSDGTCQG
jgi:hypothetical protein